MGYYDDTYDAATSATPRTPRRHRWIARAGRGVILTLCSASIICFAASRIDAYVLRTVASDVTRGLSDPAAKAIVLNHWIHAHLPTMRNAGAFAWSRLRATPTQVLDRGGDCADKSRLLSAMLRELGIPATMAMLFDPRTGGASHTIVEAQPQPGLYMVLDPAFELYYPNPSGAGYLGLIELRRDPNALPQRLAELQAANPWPALCHSYPVTYAAYDRASTFNWNKNALIRTAHDVLFRWSGDEMYRWPRPIVVEEPKLFVTVAALAAAAGLLLAMRLAALLQRRRARVSDHSVVVANGSQMISEALNTGPSVQHSR